VQDDTVDPSPISPYLGEFLARFQPFYPGTTAWAGGVVLLDESHYLSHELPPLPYVTSVRSLVRRGDMVLLVRNRDGHHILPGGRREEGETVEATVRRRVRKSRRKR
jgi:hypothetical protein